jgi:hypothetical protein
MMPLNNTKKLIGKKISIVITWIIFMLFITVFSGCTGAYGRLKIDPKIRQSFLQKQMISGYHYYYVGRASLPYAIVGIKDGYVFSSRFWESIPPGSGQFGKLVGLLYGSDFSYPIGAKILSPEGNLVGFWFSTVAFATIEFGPDNQVIVYSPYRPTRRSSLL